MPSVPPSLFTTIAERLFQASPNGVMVYQFVSDDSATAEPELVLVNAMAERSLGPLPDPAKQPTADVLKQVFQTGETYRTELEVASSDRAKPIVYDVSVVRMDGYVAVFYVDVTDRRRAQQAEQEHAERTKFILDNALTAIATLDAVRDDSGRIVNFTYTMVNRVVEQLSGLPAAQLVGQRLLTLFPGTRASGLFDKWVAVVETGEPLHFFEHFQQGNKNVWYETRAVRLGDGLIESFSDVTELRRVQATQQEQAELLKTIVENGKVGMTLFDVIRDDSGVIVDFEYVFTNSVNAANTGRTVAEMTGNRLLQLFPGIVDTPFFSTIVEAANTGEARQVVIPYFADGVSGWYDITFVGMGNRVLFTDLDVTKNKQAELEQQRQAAFLTQLVDTSMSGIAVYKATRDEQHQLVDFQPILFNPAAAAIMQATGDELYGQTLRQRFSDEAYPGLFAKLVAMMKDDASFRSEFYYIGVDKWLDLLGTRLDDGFLLLFNDITEQHQRRRQLEQANLELQRSNDNLQQFAYVASHDLQEPLRKIRAFGDLLLGQYGPVLGHDGADMIGRMQSAAGRMSTLIIDLLAYSRISTHRDPFQRLSLTNLLTDVCDDLSLVISETQAEVKIETLPDVLGGTIQLRQLFQNMLSNALKFRQPDRQPIIQITSRFIFANELPSGLMPAPGDAPRFLEISFTDNGIGFDDKYRDRIFQVFQRLHTKSQYTGTGVGLAICRKVVENHGGTIGVTSRVGEGSTFRVYLPG
ncbi:PAS domain-containing sensor histidine kinase [Spirosoma arcticum]